MILGVVKETYPGERRVAIVPATVPALIKAKIDVVVQSGAGADSGFSDEEYSGKGARIVDNRAEVFRTCDVLCQVRTLSANPQAGRDDLPLLRRGQTVIGLADPLADAEPIQWLAGVGVQSFALELLPRITRAQAMDVLSSQATVAGYKAALLAASRLPRMAPMMMTAAGTIAPAKVLVIGAGVAGLQAIASARRLGTVVHAYDVRPAVKEQVQSLGARFLELDLSTASAETAGGYAKAMDEEFYRKQRELMAKVVAQQDVVITTAAVPGAKPPLLITADMVGAMARGGVIVDLAARLGQVGGNCELTKPDEEVDADGVTILGPTNLPATVPHTASQMYSRNMAAFVMHSMSKDDGKFEPDLEDEIVKQTLLTRGGEIVNPRLKARPA